MRILHFTTLSAWCLHFRKHRERARVQTNGAADCSYCAGPKRKVYNVICIVYALYSKAYARFVVQLRAASVCVSYVQSGCVSAIMWGGVAAAADDDGGRRARIKLSAPH